MNYPKKINICYLITQLGIGGGAEKVVYDLCTKGDHEQFNYVVISLAALEETVMYQQFQDANIPVKILAIQKSPIAVWKTWLKLLKIIKTYQIDVLHAHLIHAGIMATLLKLWMPKLRFVFTSHNYNLGSKFREFFTRSTKKLRNADIIFSEDMQTTIYKKEVNVIPNGIAIADYQIKVPKFDKFTFICIGRLSAQKNQLALIEPVKKLKNQGYQFQLLLAGEGPDEEKLNQAIQAENLTEYIQLLGIRKDIPTLCNQVHCLVMSSLWEGLPIVLLEAGASRLPVISTDVGSVSSLIDEKTGYLITHTDELVGKMQKILDNYSLATQKGVALYQRIQKDFSIEKVVQQHEDLYKELVINTPNYSLVTYQ